MRRTGQVLACCSMKTNVVQVSPRRCRSLFLGRRARCASGRVHVADGRSRPLGRRGKLPGSQEWLPIILLSAGGGEPPISAERHCLSIEGWIPSSAAICICGRPLLSRRATASRLNAGVNSRRVLAIKHLPRPQGAYQRCPWNRSTIRLQLRELRRQKLVRGLVVEVARVPGLEGLGDVDARPEHRLLGLGEVRRLALQLRF